MKVKWISNKKFEILPTDEYDMIQQFTNYAYPNRLIVLETKSGEYIEPRETHLNKETAKIISIQERENSLLKGELDLDENYFMRYYRVIRKLGYENEIQEIINKSTNKVEQKSEPHLANRGIQGDESRRKNFQRFLESKKSILKHENFMKYEYSSWKSEKKVEYWYGRLLFQEKMQTQVTNGIGNFGLYMMDKKSKARLLKYENNWKDFEEKYCKKFNIPLSIGKKLFKLEAYVEEWISLAEKVGYIK